MLDKDVSHHHSAISPFSPKTAPPSPVMTTACWGALLCQWQTARHRSHPACVVIMQGFIMQGFIISGFHAESHPELPEKEYAARETTARWRPGL